MMNYETLTHFEEVDKTLAYLYRELCSLADDVNNEQRDLDKMVASNREDFARGGSPFYGRSLAEQAADYERALAKYEVIERAFWTAAHDAGIERDDVAQLIVDSRKSRWS